MNTTLNFARLVYYISQRENVGGLNTSDANCICLAKQCLFYYFLGFRAFEHNLWGPGPYWALTSAEKTIVIFPIQQFPYPIMNASQNH